MAAPAETCGINLPKLPVPHAHFIDYIGSNKHKPVGELVEPYKQYDTEMRKVFAQQPGHPAAKEPSIVAIFQGPETVIQVRARDPSKQSEQEREAYIMPLKNKDRKPDGAPAIVQSLKDFRTNFNVFSESALVDMDWSNVVVAGSAVVTSLLAVPDKHAGSKRALREYYHEQVAPASDVDLFIYGLSEADAIAKIKQIEQNIRDAILVETTTVRTKNAITIASQYPTRHVQIVLRIYKSISEILTGFDVDCSCAAYDGQQVYASPRALVAYVTQTNTIDLTRRSPSYESRLSKYAHRGFEIHWPGLDRSRIDPTIFERSFGRTEGLARLLILEKLPRSQDRDAYIDQRRAERGRPAINRWRINRHKMRDNIKDEYQDEVAEWVDSDEVSDYHTFTIPYGPKFHAKKIEKLLYTKDLLLNAEWNKPKDREVNLHRHPAFFGRADDVFHDCCGSCPKPGTIEEEEVAEEEGKIYVSGEITFIKDDPGRQAIGSFNPLTADDWTEMAYVGNTELLCRAIVDGDMEHVRSWLEQEGNDPNTRDFTGRTPLHLAASNSSLEVVQCLIDFGARLVARLVDGRTALHLAAMRGNADIVSALLRKSESNNEEEQNKVDARRAARVAAKRQDSSIDVAMQEAKLSEDQPSVETEKDSDIDMVDDAGEDENMDATTENSMVKIRQKEEPQTEDRALEDAEEDQPDVYDVNVLAWDIAITPLHLAIVNGHLDVVRALVQEFGADVLLPIKLFNDYDKSARAAILTLVLALRLPLKKADAMTRLLIELGASSAQADMQQNTALQYCVAGRAELLSTLLEADETGASRAMKHLANSGSHYTAKISSVLITAIKAKDSLTALRLLTGGAKVEIDFSAYMTAFQTKMAVGTDSSRNRRNFDMSFRQPIVEAIQCELPDLAKTLIEDHGIDPNTLTPAGWTAFHEESVRTYHQGKTVLDEIQEKLEELRRWKHQNQTHYHPSPLEDDAAYMTDLQEGSYAWWSAHKQLSSAKKAYERDLAVYEKNCETANSNTGVPEKEVAVRDMIDRFEKLEAVLLQRGAKTFYDLFPDIKKPEDCNQNSYPRWEPEKPKPFEVKFEFQLGNLTDEAQKGYLRLFEAAWLADVQTVKQLTLLPQKDSNGEEHAPLIIAVRDQHNLSPFAIAVLQGQFDLANAIMEIAQAQYVRPEQPKTQRYRFDGQAQDGDDDSDSANNAGLPVYSEIVDEEFTIETIGAVSKQVQSRTRGAEMLQWACPVSDFMGGPLRSSPSSSNGFRYFGPRRQSHSLAGKRTNTGSLKAASKWISNEKRSSIGDPTNLFQFALHNDDLDLLIYLLSLAQNSVRPDAKSNGSDESHNSNVFERSYIRAVRLDRPHLVAEIVRRTGAGIPLNRLVEKSGVEVKEKPKYYQGLSVYGKKRKDWADAGRGQMNSAVVENHRPGLLQAAYHQSLETVEWFLSDAPMRCYQEFAKANKNDKRIKILSEAKDGFEGSVSKFLNARSHLAIHCCVLGRPMPESIPLLRFLIKTMPKACNAKNEEGKTPLQISFWHYREEAAKVLIEAGADQTSRDKSGNNIIHSLFRRPVSTQRKLETLPRMLDLIDKRLLPSLFIERCSEHPGALTPLAQWVKQVTDVSQAYGRNGDKVLRTLLDYSKGEDLNVVNGEGHTALHVAVRQNSKELVRVLLDADPTLILRENATGRTPFEMAEDALILATCSDPPSLPGVNNNHSFNYQNSSQPFYFRTAAPPSILVHRSPSSFVEEPDQDNRSDRHVVWDYLQETKALLEAQGRTKRKLVTLNEANEVARRLAANKSMDGIYRRAILLGEHDDEGVDEVEHWMPSARSYLDDHFDPDTDSRFSGRLRRYKKRVANEWESEWRM